MDIRNLLRSMADKDASDIHLKVGTVPIFRISKELVPQEDYEKLTRTEMTKIISDIANEDQRRQFNEKNEVDYAYIANDIGRFRVNIFKQRGECGIVMRRIKEAIPTFTELNLPKIFEKIAMFDRGIILITGASSSGKTTTLASIVDYINMNKNKHIITLENPIEYIYKDKKAIINQREIGIDAKSFREALRYIMRQDPDIIVIGEMRDKESIAVSLSAAESGHLVLSSFHAEDAAQAIARLLDFFSSTEKNLIRMQLANNLKTITSQRLLKRSDVGDSGEQKLIPAVEVLIVNAVVSKLIRDNKVKDVYKVLQTGEDGMCSFNMSLVNLYKNKMITKEEALSKSSNPEALKINLKGIYLDEDRSILG